MNRRFFLTVPGIGALAASRGLAQGPISVSGGGVARPSRKALVRHSGSKASYKVPKSAAKQAKYLASVTALVALTTSQQEQAAAIFANAASTRKSVHRSLKAARKTLAEAVRANDTAAIAQVSTTMSNLLAQHISSGALANAAFLQLLAPDQQARLSQFQS